MNIDPRLIDHAYKILVNEPSLTGSEKANLWDQWHDSKNAAELQTRLSPVDLPVYVEQQLVAAKQLSEPQAPELTALDRAVTALARIKQINPQTLSLAEKYSHVAKMLVDAAREESR